MEVAERFGRGPVALDTAVFIYFIAEHPTYLPLVEPIFTAVAAGRLTAVTSALTLLETLVVPYRSGDVSLSERYEALLTRSRGLRLIALDAPVLRVAAQLRARAKVTTPDALQLAGALHARATAFVTHDRRLPDVPGMRIVSVSDLR